MVRLETGKGSKGKASKPSGKSNKENSSPEWEADPYAGETQTLDLENLISAPSGRSKNYRLKKASGRFQSAKSPTVPFAEHATNIQKQAQQRESDSKPAELKRKGSLNDKPATKLQEPQPTQRPKTTTISFPSSSSSASSSFSPNSFRSSSLERLALAERSKTIRPTTGHTINPITLTTPLTKQAKRLATKGNADVSHRVAASRPSLKMYSPPYIFDIPTKALKVSATSSARSRTSALVDLPLQKKLESRPTKAKMTTKFLARHQVFISRDMMLLVARFLPGMELVRLGLANSQLQGWLGTDPNHRLWHELCVAAFRKFRFPKRSEDSWKRRYLQSLAICEACDFYASGCRVGVVACICCCAQYCGFNPPPGHVRFPSTPGVNPVAPRKVGMCYEQCWTLCWRCNDLIVMQNQAGQTGAVCRTCCPPDRDVCEQCRETILLARNKHQWQTRRDEHKVARGLGLNDTTAMGEFVMDLEDDNRSVTSQYSRYERSAPVLEESIAETSTIFDPYF